MANESAHLSFDPHEGQLYGDYDVVVDPDAGTIDFHGRARRACGVGRGMRKASDAKVSVREGPMQRRGVVHDPKKDCLVVRLTNIITVPETHHWGSVTVGPGSPLIGEQKLNKKTLKPMGRVREGDTVDWMPDRDDLLHAMSVDYDEVRDIARTYGPLFGGLGLDDPRGSEVIEGVHDWEQASLMLQIAMRIAAVVDKKSDARTLNDILGFTVFRGVDERTSKLQATMELRDRFDGLYAEYIKKVTGDGVTWSNPRTEGSLRRGYLWLNPDDPGSFVDGTYEQVLYGPKLTCMAANGGYRRPDENPYVEQRTVDGFAEEERPFRNEVLLQLAEALSHMHLVGVGFSWVDHDFGLSFPDLLSRVWYDYSRALGEAVIGVCPVCGKVFSGRKDKKYCSECQTSDKSRRQATRNKEEKVLAEARERGLRGDDAREFVKEAMADRLSLAELNDKLLEWERIISKW